MTRMLVALGVLALAVPAFADKKVDDAVAKAESQLAKGRTDEAEKTMDKLTQQQPTAEAWAARARVQLKLGNVEGAATSAAEGAKAAGSASPEMKADALSTLAALDLERGAGKDAVAHAQEAVAASPSAASLAALARAQARMGDPAAVETANKAVAAGAQSAAAHEAQGHALLAMQRGEEAAAAFRKALELEPKRASARAGLANALVATGKAAEAVTEAKKATEDNDKSGEAFAAYATALYAAAPNKEQGWGEAINQAQQGAFVSPRNPVVQVAVGRLFEAGGNLPQAEMSYKKALEADPGYVPAQLQVLQVESRKGDLAAAIARAKGLAQSQPQNMDVQVTLGKLLARNGDWDEAVVPLDKAAKAMPASAEVQALAGTAYQYVGQSDNALAAYKKAVQLAPNNNEYRSTYGLLLGLNKQYAEGIAELQKVTGAAGYKDAAGWVNLGWLYRNVDPPKAAESAQAYEKALQIDPKNAQAALGLGWAHLTGQQYDQAIGAFNKAIALDKATAGEAYNGIGWSHFFKKDIAQAKATAEQAKAAGRNVASLVQNIDRFEKGQAAAEDARREFLASQRAEGGGGGGGGSDAGSLCSQVQRGGAGAIGAARKLGGLGAGGVQCLVYAVSSSQDIGLKQAAASALGNIGGAARSACPHLGPIVRGNPYEQTMMDAKQQELWVRWEDLRRVARGAMGKIGC
jgi:tetratricopeptide (TPR) repeat protein